MCGAASHYANVTQMFRISIMLLLLICIDDLKVGAGEISMKIVEGQTSYGIHNAADTSSVANTLTMRVTPSKFSGPPHLQSLLGKCFSSLDDSYKYEFCPFQNVTQHEQSLRWNPFSGILGVWQEWKIVNNSFVSMVMREGDSCGQIFRSVDVKLECGKRNKIHSVTEPRTCHYEMVFKTPLVCHEHSLLVYPTLKDDLQERWDYLEGELSLGYVTEKGYHNRLKKILEDAGYCLPKDKVDKIAEEAKNKEAEKKADEQTDEKHFTVLEECKEEYAKLKKEIETLRTLVDLNQQDSKAQNNSSYIHNHNMGFIDDDYDESDDV